MRASPDDVAAPAGSSCAGVTGSGKSTLAEAAAARLGVRYVEGDAIGWRPGWVNAPEDEQRREVSEILAAEDGWVFDTAWSSWRDLVLPHDRPGGGAGLPARRLAGSARAPDRAPDPGRHPDLQRERRDLAQTFSRDSIVAWHFRSFAEKRTQLRAWEADPAMPPVLRLSRPGQATAGWRRWAPERTPGSVGQ